MDDALTSLAFSMSSSSGSYAVLVGAGVSAASGIPTAWGVLTELTSRIAALSEGVVDDPIAWYEARFGEPPRYETVLERLARTPQERQQLLRSFFEPSEDSAESRVREPTDAHRSLARLVRQGHVRVILTLNFDHLIEHAIQAEGIEPTVVSSPAAFAGLAPLHTLQCCVIHLHGEYLDPGSMLNTLTELGAYQSETQRLLTRVLEDYGLVVAGWSGTYDPALRDAIASHYPGRYTMFWIDPHPQSNEANQLLTLKNGVLLPGDADTAIGVLADRVESLTTLRSRHPLTLSATVETMKRELSGRYVAIRAHDVLAQEFARVHELDEFHVPSYQTAEPYGGFAAMVDRVEDASRLSSAMVAAAVYWGNVATDRWWLDEIVRFSRPARGGGLVRLLWMRTVTGSMLFYAAGVAAVASRRYDLLHGLLSLKTTEPVPYTGEASHVGILLDADRVFSEVGGTSRLRQSIGPLLAQTLTIGPQVVDDAWQQFELLRLARSAMESKLWPSIYAKYCDALEKLLMIDDAYDPELTNAFATDDEQASRAEAFQNKERTLGALANQVTLVRPHLLGEDSFFSSRWTCPAADRLAADLATEADNHPLVLAGVAKEPAELSAALQAVSVAAGRVAHDRALVGLPHNEGAISTQIWIDTDETPTD